MKQSISTAAEQSFLANTKAADGLACLLDQAKALIAVLVQDEGYSTMSEPVLGNMLDILQEKLFAMESNLLNIDTGMGVMQ